MLLIVPATPDRKKSVIDGGGGGVEDVSTLGVNEALTPLDTEAPARAGLATAASLLIAARAALAVTAPARSSANVVEPTSPAITRLAMRGISAIAKA